MWLLNKNQSKTSSRAQIAIKEVVDGVLVLPNNEYRIAIETSSINFELKSQAEQDVLIDNFQTFLNSLPCSLQILTRVREVNIDDYLDSLHTMKNQEDKKIYQEQIKHYATFVAELVKGNKILSRRFYLILPYHASKSEDLDMVKSQLQLNRDIVIKGLERLHMKARQLDSLEILDLFYSSYNPSQIKTQQLKGHTIQTLLRNHHA
ncbi:MAG: TraC family protein [Patescibacteria group bacterium]